MFTKSKRAVDLTLIGLGLFVAAEVSAEPVLERVEITGSSIRRVDAEGALPVQVLRREDIERTGAANVRDLIQLLPAMQGFVTSSDSVNGGEPGTATASLRNLGSEYTLVLLNGRRMAPYDNGDKGSTVNLDLLPLSAIERVEILTDGASALYGADAVAGVINFITKSNQQSGEIDIRYAVPQRAGGKAGNFSIGKGFGDVESDGFNVYGSFAYDKEDRVLARQRPWSRSGVVPFTAGGRNLYFWSTSIASTPPNVDLYDAGGNNLAFFNPSIERDGACTPGPRTFTEDGYYCGYDYAAMADLLPETERKSGFFSGEFQLNDKVRVFGEALLSRSTLRSGYAPPAEALVDDPSSGLYGTYVAPYLAGLGVTPGDVDLALYYTRFEDAGQRRDEYRNQARHFVIGSNAQYGDFDYTVSFTRSRSDLRDRTRGGYLSETGLYELIANGDFDPFNQGSLGSREALASASLDALAFKRESELDVWSVRGSGPLFDINGREAYIGFGVDLTKQRYKDQPDAIFQGPNALEPDVTDAPIGTTAGRLPFDAQRKSRGLFAELMLPVLKELEVTGSVRYDDYDAPRDSLNFSDGGATLLEPAKKGNHANETTYKLSARFQPSRSWLFRGSVGTGFRAPTLGDVAAPMADFGVIGVRRSCPVGAGDPLYAGCRAVPTQYRLFQGGNALSGDLGLKPETSDQWTVGFRFEPTADFGVGLDYWSVKIKNAITEISEDTAFDNFELYRELFTLTSGDGGLPILTFNQTRVNAAQRVSKGVDWDVVLRSKFDGVRITNRFVGTYLIDSYYDLGFGNGQESSIGKLGSDDQVAFRVLTRLSTTMEVGRFAHTVTWSWRPGYKDQSYRRWDYVVREQLPDGSAGDPVAINNHRVSDYSLVDWQTVYVHSDALSFSFGIKNLFDRAPPFTIKTVAGNQVGVDPRYHDVLGRTFYLSLKAAF